MTNYTYYYQMHQYEKQWGYFMMWTPYGLHYEKSSVAYYVTFVNEMLSNLTEFYQRYFLMRFPRRLTQIKL